MNSKIGCVASLYQFQPTVIMRHNGSVANSVFEDISVFRNTVKIGVYENELPDKQLFATEPRLLLGGIRLMQGSGKAAGCSRPNIRAWTGQPSGLGLAGLVS